LLRQHGTNKINKLILGDNLSVLKTLYEDPTIRRKVDLIYIDPPFGTGQDFIGYHEDNAYSDRLVNTEFLKFLRKRLILLKELLSKKGSIYLHIDQKTGHYVKIIMDEVFGEENFRNDITRIKCNPKNFERKAFGNIKDVIYFYSKSKPNDSDPMYWTDYRIPLSEEEIVRQFPKIDKLGRRYATTPLHAKGETRNGPTGRPWKGLKPPKGRHWRYGPEELTRLDKHGLIEWSSTGNPRKIIYAEENRGKKIQDIWDFKDPGFEKSIYPTEKNEEMLKQIILSSSNEGDIVLDCFAGSGTTLVVAEKLKRFWIGIDANKSALETSEKRLLALKRDLFDKPASFNIYKTT
jgi:adenine-specific DNA-methyltransferase